ncbi:MAG TPA: MFS transporter, partial [Chroococcales cyanobacterium]
QGSVAIGSAVWGQVAVKCGLVIPLVIAAGVLCAGLIANLRYRLSESENLDTTASYHWRDPKIVHQPEPEHGPVLISGEYIIDPARAREFTEAMAELKRQRMRDGAFSWHLFVDLANPSRYVESFMVESWGEHVRQHERATVQDRLVEEKCFAFHLGSEPHKVQHLISAYASDVPPNYPTYVANSISPGLGSATEIQLDEREAESSDSALPLKQG